MKNRTRLLALAVAGWIAGTAARGADWPGWRGPTRDGQAAGFRTPATWPAALKKQWQIEVGPGHASPLLVGDAAFVFSRQGDNEVVRAVRLADGREIWSQRYPAPFTMSPYALGHGKGPKSTPATDGSRLMTLGIGDILSAWDAKTGKPLWQHDFSKKYKTRSSIFYGAAASPLIDGDRVIAHVGCHNEGALVALEAATGKTVWQWDGDGPGYASPVRARFGGLRQVVTQSQKACIAVNAETGELLWSIPFETEYDQNIITPVAWNDLVVFSGLDKGTAAYRPVLKSGKWTAEPVWKNDEAPMYMSSPVVAGDLLVGLSHKKKGQLFRLDLRSGKLLAAGDGRTAEYATLVVAGDSILVQTNSADWLALPASGDSWTARARYKTSETAVWAHPAYVDNKILVKDSALLILWTIE